MGIHGSSPRTVQLAAPIAAHEIDAAVLETEELVNQVEVAAHSASNEQCRPTRVSKLPEGLAVWPNLDRRCTTTKFPTVGDREHRCAEPENPIEVRVDGQLSSFSGLCQGQIG